MSELYPDGPGFERRDTSYDAAQKVSARALRALVIVLHDHHKIGGLTDDELDEFKPPGCPTLRPRRCELTAKGMLFDTGRRRMSKKGRRMIVWSLPPK